MWSKSWPGDVPQASRAAMATNMILKKTGDVKKTKKNKNISRSKFEPEDVWGIGLVEKFRLE